MSKRQRRQKEPETETTKPIPVLLVAKELLDKRGSSLRESLERLRVEQAMRWMVKFERGVTHVVCGERWLREKKSGVESLYVLAEAASLCLVAPEWVLKSLEEGSPADESLFAVRDTTFETARLNATSLLAGNLCVCSGGMREVQIATISERAFLRKSGGGATNAQLSLDRCDVVVLAALHGARVLSPSGLPSALSGFLWRGYAMAHLLERCVPPTGGQPPVVRVFVPSTNSVSKLGVQIYQEKLSLRPLLVDWLITSVQSQRLADPVQFEVYV